MATNYNENVNEDKYLILLRTMHEEIEYLQNKINDLEKKLEQHTLDPLGHQT